ncbi:MAG: FAD-binding oxidoreductase [Burkholderiales bacterium]|jgi:FAD/FMN-containing dehydrogenase
MTDPRRRSLLAAAGTLAPAALLPGAARAETRIVMNDASRLSPTPVFRHWVVRPDPQDAWIAALRDALAQAARQRRPVVVGAARHSMGGQSLARNGLAVTFEADRVEVDRAAGIARVHAGARWHQVIAALDPLGLSPAVMQSNSDFSVGATFSVNAHGWPVPYGPFGSTVRAARLMLADGSIVTASRTEHPELFAMAMGGYGLVGILLDLEIAVVENRMMRPRFERMPAGELARRFTAALRDDPQVTMLYGRLNVARAELFTEALLVTWRPESTPAEGLPAATRRGALTGVSREIYRAQIGSETGKKARWFAETVAVPKAVSGAFTRNSLINEPVSNLEGRDRRRTDILHEYFVHPDRFGDFLAACRELIPKARAEFLNVTLRWVAADDAPVLSYSGVDRIAAVMSFSQEVSPEGEADMLTLTEALIDRVAAIGGAYYLPYRLHARPDQFRAVYPRAERFAERKRHFDPQGVFRHALWDAYLAE